MKRILIAEDDVDIRQALVDLLEGEGYGVTAVGDGEKAIDAWRTAKEPFDLLLLDVMMPEKSGYDVCRTVRAAGSSVAVLMLSAKGAEIDKVVGLELGADDYVTKPFGVRELLARIAAALRRSAPQKTSDLAADDFDFACAAVSVKRYCLQGAKGSEPITDIEMKLMRAFAAHRDEVLSRDALLNAVWGQDYFGTTRTLDQHVANLRRKLEKVGGKSQLIGTVHGVGYRYNPGDALPHPRLRPAAARGTRDPERELLHGALPVAVGKGRPHQDLRQGGPLLAP